MKPVSTRWAKLRSVDSTAALSDDSLTRAVDATASTKRFDYVRSVCGPGPSRRNRSPNGRLSAHTGCAFCISNSRRSRGPTRLGSLAQSADCRTEVFEARTLGQRPTIRQRVSNINNIATHNDRRRLSIDRSQRKSSQREHYCELVSHVHDRFFLWT